MIGLLIDFVNSADFSFKSPVWIVAGDVFTPQQISRNSGSGGKTYKLK